VLSAIVVGAGFSGLCAGIKLRDAGFTDFVILEKAHGVGGTWRDNTYPGAACDVPSHLYSYSFAPNPKWTRAYGQQPEILAYLEEVATRFALRPHLRFGERVTSAVFDATRACWRVTTEHEVLEARALILGNGALHVPAIPDLPGLARFGGATFHSAAWNHAYELAGKRVAAIGTGASAIQFVPEIAKVARELVVYQRTPPWILPKRDPAIGRRERWLYEHVPGAHWLRRASLYWQMESRVIGFAYAPKVFELLEPLVKRHLAREVLDPELRRKLTPDYRFGCKRILISNEYYRALQRPNVTLETDPIAEIDATSVRTTSGVRREVDAIVFGTGFQISESISALHVVGANGLVLDDVWQQTLRHYLGITVSGFPNMFLLMGPNTALGHNSMIFMIEAQVRYAVAALCAMRERNLGALDVRPEVEAAFHAELAERMTHTVWTTGCASWYQTTSGELFLWPAATVDYWLRTRRIDLRDYATTPREAA